MKFKFLLVTFLLSTTIFAQTWTEKNKFPVRDLYLSSFVVNNEAYVLHSTDASLYRYNSNEDTWTKIPINWMENMGYQNGFVIPVGNKVYVAAGAPAIPTTSSRLFYEYDPTENTWTKKNDLPNFIDISSLTFPIFSYNNKGYILYSGRISTYDPESDTWDYNISEYPGRPYYFSLAHFVIDDKFYAGSGANSATETSPNFYQYDPEINSWEEKATYPDPSQPSAMVSFVVKSTAYTGLGAYPEGSGFIYKSQFYSYSPSTDSWSSISDCGYAAKDGFSFSLNGKGYVGTGWTTAPNLKFYDDLWEFSPTTLNIEETSQPSIEFQLYPNPTSGLLNFKTENDVSRILIENLLGQQIKEYKITKSNQIDITELKNGVYVLTFFDKNRKLKSKLILKK